MENICIIKNCDNISVSYGLCDKHRKALSRTGDARGFGLREGKCLQCGNIFKAKSNRKKYCNVKCYSLSPGGKKKHQLARKAYYEKNRYTEGHKARKAVGRKKIKITDSCLVCNTKKHLHRHHHNYNRRHDITVLCAAHHRELHRWDSIKG